MFGQNVDNVLRVKVGTSDTDLGDILCGLWLLSLNLRVELHLSHGLGLDCLSA